MLFHFLIRTLSGFLMIKRRLEKLRIRIVGSEEQVYVFQEYLKRFNMTECTFISNPYPQTRKNQFSKNVAVYMEFKDWVKDEK